MNAIVYMLAAFFCGAFALRAWMAERDDPIRRAFMVLGALASLSFAGFTLYLVPGIGAFRYLHSVAGAFLPATCLWFFDRLLNRPGDPPSAAARRLVGITTVVVIVFLAIDIGLFRDRPGPRPSEVALAVFVFSGFGLVLHRLGTAYAKSDRRVERARLRYLIGLLTAAVVFTALEQIARGLGPAPEPSSLSLGARPFALQGAFPPLGALFATLFIYFLHQVVLLYRLLDLHEIFTRLFTLATAGVALVAIDGIAVLWVGSLSQHPAHGLFQLFLASTLFLSLYDPMRRRIETLAGEWFNLRGRTLEVTLEEVDASLAKVISIDGLDIELVARLQSSGRAPLVTLYLWDPDRGTYRLSRRRGPSEVPLMQEIAPTPFAEGFRERGGAYLRAGLNRIPASNVSAAEVAAARLRTLDAMGADLCLPIRSGDFVLGWLNLKDEPWSDGFSTDEVRRLQATVDRVSIVLENLHAFSRLEENHRLAALGTMSAGLAHEIRNPLAGIQGAAQYLQQGADEEEMKDFLDIIVQEVARLDGVVGQFLDYARPFDVHKAPADLDALASRVVDLVRAEGLPAGVHLEVEGTDSLPRTPIDVDRVIQVVLNLVHNAIAAVGTQGTVAVRTAMGAMQDEGRRGTPALELSVEDDGPGIEVEVLEKLFIPFFTTRANGTGLGLPISRRIAEAHGGELSVRSTPGRGATFTLRLPLPVEAPMEERPDQPVAAR